MIARKKRWGLALAALALPVALALAATFWGRSDAPLTPAPSASVSESPAPSPALTLRQRLADAKGVLLEGPRPADAARLPSGLAPPAPVVVVADGAHEDGATALGIWGGEVAKAAPRWAVRLKIHYGSNVYGDCTGSLITDRGRSAILTAAHCFDEGWEGLTLIVGEAERVDAAAVSYSSSRVVIHKLYEGQDTRLRYDLAMIVLPDNPGGGLKLPQTPREILSVGEDVTIWGYGLTEGGRVSERLKWTVLPVAEVRPLIVRLDGALSGFRGGDSGGPVLRTNAAGEDVLVGVISHYDHPEPGRQPDKMWIIPLDVAWIRGILAAYRVG